jgi:hypothetical protein
MALCLCTRESVKSMRASGVDVKTTAGADPGDPLEKI